MNDKITVLVNGRNIEIDASTTVLQLLDQLHMPGQPVAVEINRHLVPREAHPQRRLSDGDRLEIVSLVGGG